MTGVAVGDVLRPYSGVDAFEDVLEDLAVQVSNQRTWVTEGDLVLGLEDFKPLRILFRWALNLSVAREAVMDRLELAHLEPQDVSLIGLARSTSSKQVRTFYEMTLVEILESSGQDEYVVPMDRRPRLLPNGPVDLEFYLLLNRTKAREGLFPHLKGTWLSSKKFTLRADLGSRFNFDWLDLDDSKRSELGLATRSPIFVSNPIGMHEAEEFADCVDAYLDVDVKRFLAESGKTAQSVLLQTQFIASVLSAACEHSIAQLRASTPPSTWSDIADTPVLGQFIRAIAEKGKCANERASAEEVYEIFLSQPDKISVAVDDLLHIKGRILALAGDSSDEESVE